MTPRICVELWGGDPNQLVATARQVESVGLDGVYLGESPTALNAETWTTLGAVALATERIRIGPVIANLLPDYRSPTLLARQGAALSALSHGRFDFRTGVGADRTAGAAWWRPAGVEYPPYTERLVEAARQLSTLTSAWNEGAHPTIELTIAASGDRALGLAERFADRWETSFATPDEWRERATRAAPHLPTSLEIDAFVGSDSDPDRVWRQVITDRRGEDLDALRARALVGSPADVARRIEALADAGVDQLVVAPHDPADHDALGRLAAAARRLR